MCLVSSPLLPFDPRGSSGTEDVVGGCGVRYSSISDRFSRENFEDDTEDERSWSNFALCICVRLALSCLVEIQRNWICNTHAIKTEGRRQSDCI